LIEFARYMDDVSLALDERRMEPREAAYKVAEFARQALQCSRASYWVLEGAPGARTMRRVAYADPTCAGSPYEPVVLRETEFGAYFDQMLRNGVYACNDTREDPRMEPLRLDYLEPMDIRASIDVAEASNGDVFGVLCCAERGRPREWSSADKAAIRKIASEVSLRRARRRARELREQAILDAIVADTPLPVSL
jgi:GAF domain-containing protein